MKRDKAPKEEELNESLKMDYLDRNIYLNNLINMLLSISEHTVIALDGKWGSGKTFFIKQLEYLSKHSCKYSHINTKLVDSFNKSFSFFYFNAWENDFLPPIESILLQLSNELWDGREKLADKFLGVAKGIINIPIKFLFNGSIDAEDFELFKKTYMDTYTDRAKVLSRTSEEIDNILSNYNENTKKKVLFVIDDLDRCKPTFAVELLETIKHSFNSNDAIFIICANNEQLQHTIKKYYGENFNGYEYLDRFYDLVISLPEPDINKYIIHNLNLKNPDYYHNQIATDIVKINHMGLRQTNRYFSNLALLEDYIKNQNLNLKGKSDHYIKNVFIQIALALKILDKKKYDDFIAGNGENILDEYHLKSDAIRSFVRENVDQLKLSYRELFNANSGYKQDTESFIKAVNLIGFTTIVDNRPDTGKPTQDG